MDALLKYIVSHSSPEHEALQWIRKQTNLRTNHARMLSGPTQGAMLTTLAQLSHAKRVLEIGTFTGYATTCLALGLEEDGHVDTLEINDELNDLILNGWERAGVKEKITLHTGDALQTLSEFADRQEYYDMVFIDANKRHYRAYYEAIFPMVKPGGLILADNTLWDRKILEDPLPGDAQTREIAAFNDMIAKDDRVRAFILPLRDGLTFILKLPTQR